MWWTAGLRRLAARQLVRDGVGRCNRFARGGRVDALELRVLMRCAPGARALLVGAGRGRVCAAWSRRCNEVGGRAPPSQWRGSEAVLRRLGLGGTRRWRLVS